MNMIPNDHLTSVQSIQLILFLIGMSLVLVGVFFAGFETIKGYEIISYEVKVYE